MGRPGINYLNVARAAEAVQSQGLNPTVDKVLAELGSGSKSTIAPLLKAWKEKTGRSGQGASLSDNILKAVTALQTQLQGEAQETIDRLREQFDAQRSQLETARDQLSADLVASEANRTRLESVEQRLNADNGQLRDEHGQQRVAIARLETAAVEQQHHIDGLRQQLTQRSVELKQFRERQEHYEIRVAEERQQEREQAREADRQARASLGELQQQLALERQRSAQLNESNGLLDGKLDSLREKNEQCERQRHEAASEIQRLERENALHSERIARLNQDNEVLEQRCTQLQGHSEDQALQLTVLTERSQQGQHREQAMQKKIGSLDAENKSLLRDNAALEVRLEQAQKRLLELEADAAAKEEATARRPE